MKKRDFGVIRNSILKELSKGEKTLNQISKDTKINWKTVDNHVIFLAANEMVEEVFSSSYVRIYRLSKKGQEAVAKLAN